MRFKVITFQNFTWTKPNYLGKFGSSPYAPALNEKTLAIAGNDNEIVKGSPK